MSTNHYVGTERSYVPKAELNCGVQRFNAHIHIGTVQSHHPITCPDLDFRLSALLERFDVLGGDHDSGGIYHRAVFVHYGLDASNEWAVALEFIKLKYDPAQDDYTFTSADTYYRPDALRLVSIGGGHDAWYGQGKPGGAYAGGVVVRHTNDPLWTAFKVGTDIEATVHAYEHILEAWIKQNDGADEDMTVRLLPICTAAQRNNGIETGFGQSCAWVLLQAPPDDVDYGPGAEFKLKGADLGSPCPPNRLRLNFVTAGLQRTPGC